MTIEYADASRPVKRRTRRLWDLILGTAVAAFFVVHIVIILVMGCPYWSICFPVPSIGPYLWPIVAIGLAIWLLAMAIFRSSKRRRRFTRLILALLLVAFATDTLTGGDYRWFEIAMRWEMRTCGGPAALQQWAQKALTSSTQVASFEVDEVRMSDLPPAIRQFAAKVCEYPYVPQYRLIRNGGPWFMFNHGGSGMGCGVIVGKRDLLNPSPVSVSPGRHIGWTKQLQPGVYLYAF